MTRRVAPFIPGNYYHICNRGNNRQAIFFEGDNYQYFLNGVKKYLCSVVSVIAYCLMPTHFHLLVRVAYPQTKPQKSEVFKTSDFSANLSRAMQRLSISYTKVINKRFDRVGALFQGAFQSKLIENHNHLLNLCVYIHANPVKDGLVENLEDWPYSNYLEWVGERTGTLVDRAFIRQHFDTPEDYRLQSWNTL
jgi:REP element-mobilizing transposase RayT